MAPQDIIPEAYLGSFHDFAIVYHINTGNGRVIKKPAATQQALG
jgi:hypothetical protein